MTRSSDPGSQMFEGKRGTTYVDKDLPALPETTSPASTGTRSRGTASPVMAGEEADEMADEEADEMAAEVADEMADEMAHELQNEDVLEPRPASGISHLSLDRIRGTSRFGIWTFLLLLFNVSLVTLTAMYATGVLKDLPRQRFFSTAANSILVLRVLTEICAVALTTLLVVVIEDLQWAMASRPEGVSLLHFVGLDSGTGAWGLLRLLATADWRHKTSSAFRLLVLISIPLPGIILMGDIRIDRVFYPVVSHPVAVGLADFDVSLIKYMTQTSRTALLVQMGDAQWVDTGTGTADPLGPGKGRCTAAEDERRWVPCEDAHTLIGGYNSISPLSDNLSDHPHATAWTVPRIRGYHVEYGLVRNLTALRDEGICHLVGSTSAAAYWCSTIGTHNELLFGSSYCPLSQQKNSSCLDGLEWTNDLQVATSMFVFRRYATVHFWRGNFSVLAVRDLSEPVPVPIRLADYLTALAQIIPGFATKSGNLSGDNSALAQYAVAALPINDSELARRLALRATRKAMSVPLTHFHANFLAPGPPIWELTEPRPGLPRDMYTTLSVSTVAYQVVAGPVSGWMFVVSAGMLLLFCAAAMVHTMRICERVPPRCGYPTLDFAAVCANGTAPPAQDTHKARLSRSLTMLGQKPRKFAIAQRIKDERVVIR